MTKSEELVALIAAMKQDGEVVDGEEFIMENDDAVSTLNELIAEARKLMAEALHMCTKTPEQDLKEKVEELINDLSKNAPGMIDRLVLSGSGILDAHTARNCDWLEARKVFIAMLRDTADRQENMMPPCMISREFKADVKNYYNLL